MTAPPPSPTIERKPPTKAHVRKKQPQVINKSPNVARKTLPLCKTVLELPMSAKETVILNQSDTTDSSDTESEEDVVKEIKSKKVSAKKKKKKKVKKKQKVSNQRSKEADDEIEEQAQTVSVLDLTQTCSLRAHSWHRTMVSTPYR